MSIGMNLCSGVFDTIIQRNPSRGGSEGEEGMLSLASAVSPETLQNWWNWLQSVDPTITFGIIFLVLLVAGMGIPIPEDIPLTFLGILLSSERVQARFGGFELTLATIVLLAFSSILTGDVAAHQMGRRMGPKLESVWLFRHALSKKRREKLNRWFKRYGDWTVFFGRMVAGIRWVTFFTAGMSGLALRKFIAFDALGALVTVPFWLGLGYVLGTNFEKILQWTSRVSHVTWIVLGSLLVAGLAIRLVVSRQKKAMQEPGTPSTDGSTQK